MRREVNIRLYLTILLMARLLAAKIRSCHKKQLLLLNTASRLGGDLQLGANGITDRLAHVQ